MCHTLQCLAIPYEHFKYSRRRPIDGDSERRGTVCGLSFLRPYRHYQRFFKTETEDPVGSASLGGFIVLTDNDVDDIVAYLKLLGPNRIDK